MDKPVSRQTLNLRFRKTLLIGVAALTGMAAMAWGINRVVTPGVRLDALRVVEVRKGAIANTINASGVVIPTHEAQIPAPLQTRVIKVHAKPGQSVAAGALLLELDDQTIRLSIDSLTEQIAQQENKVQAFTLELEHILKQRASEIELAELDLQSAQVKLARYQKTGSLGITSLVDLQAAELAVKRGAIQVRQLRETIGDTRRSTQTNIEAARLQKSIFHKQLAQQQNLQGQTQVRAPFAGMVSWLLADEGASVGMGQLVAKVSELHNYRVEATVSDFYARYLNPGQVARIEYSGQTFMGKVHTILPEIQGGTVKLLISLDQASPPQLRDKLRVEVNIITEQKTDVLIADSGPAVSGSGRQDVFVLNELGNSHAATASKRALIIGLSDGKTFEIVKGAQLGERLIVSDVSRFKHLDTIQLRP